MRTIETIRRDTNSHRRMALLKAQHYNDDVTTTTTPTTEQHKRRDERRGEVLLNHSKRRLGACQKPHLAHFVKNGSFREKSENVVIQVSVSPNFLQKN